MENEDLKKRINQLENELNELIKILNIIIMIYKMSLIK
jgi:hypothetical protein